MTGRKRNPSFQILSNDEKKSSLAQISDRRTPEVIFGFIGPVGSGVTTVSETFRQILENEYKYTIGETIKISKLISEYSKPSGILSAPNPSPADRVTMLQQSGNQLRKTHGPDILAKLVIEQIARWRQSNGFKSTAISTGAPQEIPLPLRHAFIVDSIKNVHELAILREVYRDSFWLVGVFAPDHIRKQRLTISHGIKPEEAEVIMNRDMGDGLDFGQMVSKTFKECDFFIRNDQSNRTTMEEKCKRILELVFFSGVHTPTTEESAMFKAANVATNSACMSRQVGAAIVDKSGELIGVGWNDVPRYAGGLYSESDRENFKDNDNRCFNWGQRFCHNDDQKRKIMKQIYDKLKILGFFQESVSERDVESAVMGTDLSSLIEFSRAVHAEMESIVSVARRGGKSLLGASLFTTTFPCHNCARHIVASGITEVYFVEPYPKSLAIQLHNDAISLDERDKGQKVVFLQYDGVAPRNALKLFQISADRKMKSGVRLFVDKKTAVPIFRPHLDSFTGYEDEIVRQVRLTLSEGGTASGTGANDQT